MYYKEGDLGENVIIHNVSGGDIYLANGVVGSGGTVSQQSRKYCIPCKPNTTYTISFNKDSLKK